MLPDFRPKEKKKWWQPGNSLEETLRNWRELQLFKLNEEQLQFPHLDPYLSKLIYGFNVFGITTGPDCCCPTTTGTGSGSGSLPSQSGSGTATGSNWLGSFGTVQIGCCFTGKSEEMPKKISVHIDEVSGSDPGGVCVNDTASTDGPCTGNCDDMKKTYSLRYGGSNILCDCIYCPRAQNLSCGGTDFSILNKWCRAGLPAKTGCETASIYGCLAISQFGVQLSVRVTCLTGAAAAQTLIQPTNVGFGGGPYDDCRHALDVKGWLSGRIDTNIGTGAPGRCFCLNEAVGSPTIYLEF